MMEIKHIEASWKDRGFSCGVWIHPPGQRWDEYFHNVDELVMPVEGDIELILDGKVIRPERGKEVLIPAMTEHSVRNIGCVTARWLYGYKCQ